MNNTIATTDKKGKSTKEAALELFQSGKAEMTFKNQDGKTQKLVNLKHDDYRSWQSTDKRLKTGTGVPHIFLAA